MNKSILICFLVGCAVAVSSATNVAWKQGTEYEYRVHGRTLSSLHEVADQYTGILIRATLKIQTLTDGRLSCRIVKPEQADIHVNLPGGWASYIPEEQLHYKPLPLSNKPFEVLLKNGAVKELLVNSEVSEWESNIIKSFVSQIQVDVQSENVIPSRINQKLEDNEFSANFKVMEPTVTGECVTVYNIMPAGEHILQHNPELVPLPHLKGNGKIMRILKNKDYAMCKDIVEHHFALDVVSKKLSDRADQYLTRTATSEIFVSGTKDRHTIQSSNTVNKIIVNPTMASAQNGMVVSAMNMTLINVKSADQEPAQLENPISVGSLVYTEGTPSEVAARRNRQLNQAFDSQFETTGDERRQLEKLERSSRSINDIRRDSSEESYESEKLHRSGAIKASMPKLDAAPGFPLLKSFAQQLKSELHLTEVAENLIKEIAIATQNPAKLAHEETLTQFSDLIAVFRMMNAKEIIDLSQRLFDRYQQNREDSVAALEWKVCRDACAQAGTGPALLAIKAWLKNKCIEREEAAEVLSVLPRAVQYPTEEYIRALYELATCQYVKPQFMVNDTAILAFTEIVRLAWVDQRHAEKHFAMNYYEQTESENTKFNFVKKEVIPYLAQKLQEAIDNDDSHKAQVYIRALGNVADKSVFAIFKPYLEGERKISNFQRLLMVVSMKELAELHPKTSRNIFFKIIVNNGDNSEVRVAATYQLMRCEPSKHMLENLAQLTYTEPSKHVRAAIKSSIESVAQLKGILHRELCENAKSAAKLLNPETYGVDYAFNHLKTYIVKEMPLQYQESLKTIFGEDSVYPKLTDFSLHLIEGDVYRPYMTVSAMLSSIKSLTQVCNDLLYTSQSSRQEPAERTWAKKVASLLNIETEKPEKFEANLLLEAFGGKRFFTLNNLTLQNIPELYQHAIRQLQAGQRFNFTKLYVDDEVQIVLPTEMSFPFIYTLKRPSLMNVGGQIQVGNLRSKNMNAQGEIRIVSAHITESKMGFITPYDKKFYIAGYSKNMMLNVPISVKVAMDMEKQNLIVDVAPVQPELNENILHIATTPYTAQDSILSTKTGPLSKRVHVIHTDDDQKYETIIGKENGIAFRVLASQEKHNIVDFHAMHETVKAYGRWAPLIALIRERDIRHSKMSIEYLARESNIPAIQFRLSYKQMQSQHAQNEESTEMNMDALRAIPVEQEESRQQEFLKTVSAGLKAPSASVVEVAVLFKGNQQRKYIATFATAQNILDNKYQQLWYLFRSAGKDAKEFKIFGSASTKTTDSPRLNFIQALSADSKLMSNVQILFGSEQEASELKLKVQFDKSDERRQALQRSPMAHLCKRQMEENKQFQHSVCANMTIQATMMDRVMIECQHKNIDIVTKNWLKKAMNSLRFLGYDYLEEKNEVSQKVNENTITIRAQMESERFEAMNVTIQTPKTQTFFKNIRVNEWVRPLVSANTQISPLALFTAKAQRRVQANSVCVIENNSANTFNNRSYPVQFGNCYHTLIHIDLAKQYNRQYGYGYVVLARDSIKSSTYKDLKIVFYYRDEAQVLDLKYVSEHKYEVYVNDKIIDLQVNQPFIVRAAENKQWARVVYQQNELKVDFDLSELEQLQDATIYYNGAQIKIAIDDKYRGQVRGLCGTFSSEPWYDFVTPRNTLVQDPRLFAASYALVDETCEGPAKDKHRLAEQTPAIQRRTIFTRVVSEQDLVDSVEGENKKSCGTRHQTRYTIENNGKTICFSSRPLPVCSSGCHASKSIEKTVGVHCLQLTSTANLYKSQIDKGASPDFSSKPVTKNIKIRVPQTCN